MLEKVDFDQVNSAKETHLPRLKREPLRMTEGLQLGTFSP